MKCFLKNKHIQLFSSIYLRSKFNSKYFTIQQQQNRILPGNVSSFSPRNYCLTSNLCWNCNKSNIDSIYFCGHCGSLLDVKSDKDYFTLLGLNNKFDVDINDLTTKYRKLQSLLHPDKYSKKSDNEQQFSLEWSSLINKAYNTIIIPIKRAEYLLKLNGIEIPADNSSLNQEFLMEMMEKNEDVENANTVEKLEKILIEIQSSLKNDFIKLENELKENNLNDSKNLFIKMKYYSSIEKTIKDKIYECK